VQRLTQRRLNQLAALSLLLSAAIVAICIRSYIAADYLALQIDSGNELVCGWTTGRLGVGLAADSAGTGFHTRPSLVFDSQTWCGFALGSSMFLQAAFVPDWFVILVLLLSAMQFRRVARRRSNPALCPHCGYDLRATPDRCPECGKIPANADATVDRPLPL
jgi:hypothetical protein